MDCPLTVTPRGASETQDTHPEPRHPGRDAGRTGGGQSEIITSFFLIPFLVDRKTARNSDIIFTGGTSEHRLLLLVLSVGTEPCREVLEVLEVLVEVDVVGGGDANVSDAHGHDSGAEKANWRLT